MAASGVSRSYEKGRGRLHARRVDFFYSCASNTLTAGRPTLEAAIAADEAVEQARLARLGYPKAGPVPALRAATYHH